MRKVTAWDEFKRRAKNFAITLAEGTLDFVFGNNKRRYIVGLGPATIPPGKTVTVQIQPQVRFCGEKILNTGDATGLFIQGMFIGVKPQLPTFNNAIPCETFGFLVQGNEMLFDECDPAIFITFQIQNVTSATLTWTASIVGRTVEPRLSR